MNLENIEKLMYEIELENDKLLEEEEKLAEHNSDYQVWVNFYNELNQKNIENKIKINQLEEELKKITRKETLLNGQLTRKDKERKEVIKKDIEKLNKEIIVNNKNKKDASETCKEIIEKSQNLESSKKIKEIKDNIDEKNEQINTIYNDSKKYIDEYDEKINNVIEQLKNASLNNENDKVISYSIELSKLQEEKTGKYYDSQKIIDFIKKNNLVSEQQEVLNNINNQEINQNEVLDNNNKQEIQQQEILGIEDKHPELSNKDDIKEKMKKAAETVRQNELKKESEIENDDLGQRIISTTEDLIKNTPSQIEELNLNRKNCAVQIDSKDKEEQLKAYNYLKNNINKTINNSSSKEYDPEFEKQRIEATDEILNDYKNYNSNTEISNPIVEEPIEIEPDSEEFSVEEVTPINNNEKLEAFKEKLNDFKEFYYGKSKPINIKNNTIKIKNIAKLGLDKSKMIISKLKNSKVVAGAIENLKALENEMNENRGRVGKL